MTQYKVQGRAITLFAGVLALTRAQAEPRLGQLEGRELAKSHRKSDAKSSVRADYTVAGEVHFKVGEIIGYDGDVPKMWADVLIDLDAVAAAEAAQAAARATVERATREHAELVAAMEGITGNANGNIDLAELQRLLVGRVNFGPTFEQLEVAWAAHINKA